MVIQQNQRANYVPREQRFGIDAKPKRGYIYIASNDVAFLVREHIKIDAISRHHKHAFIRYRRRPPWSAAPSARTSNLIGARKLLCEHIRLNINLTRGDQACPFHPIYTTRLSEMSTQIKFQSKCVCVYVVYLCGLVQ